MMVVRSTHFKVLAFNFKAIFTNNGDAMITNSVIIANSISMQLLR